MYLLLLDSLNLILKYHKYSSIHNVTWLFISKVYNILCPTNVHDYYVLYYYVRCKESNSRKSGKIIKSKWKGGRKQTPLTNNRPMRSTPDKHKGSDGT